MEGRDLDELLIVGIGASAGGIAALEAFFSRVPAESGMAFVVVTHLSPDRKSMLAEVVARQTAIRVCIAEDGTKAVADTVYILPEGRTITIKDGCLRLTPLDPRRRERKPVDVFLCSLAEDQRENAVGIIMSGGDSDGTLGIKAIRRHGGITMAQIADGTGPSNPEMPDNAIASGSVDFALPVEEMFAQLQQIRQGISALLPLFGGDPEKEFLKLRQPQLEIAKLLRGHSGHDFSGYKSKTFLRRVARRMQVLQLATIEAYIEHLRESSAERLALFRDMLINVTSFFRDPNAFEALKSQVLVRLAEGKGADQTIRIWVPGCATGEEVYSIGILMCEVLDTLSDLPRVQIFATDIDDAALSVARAGRYPQSFLDDLDPDRARRFFRQDGGGVVVCKEVREMCIFSPHSVTGDPPFSRMDLISCRNLLIYLGTALQDQVIPTLHYALNSGGYLFLGMAENTSRFGDLFSVVDKKHRIFQSREKTTKLRRLPVEILARLPRGPVQEGRGVDTSRLQLRQRIESQILEHHTPAHVVISQGGEIVYYSANTGRYLQMPRGTPSRQLMDTVRLDLRLDLRVALQQVIDTGLRIDRRVLLLDEARAPWEMVNLCVERLPHTGAEEPLLLVVFAPMLFAPQDEPLGTLAGDAERREAGERDLRELRERLQSTVEEYETAMEELKASNEELMSVNEEAQSTNEELEASKEEAQSLNEELSTINAELHVNVELLDRANADLKNLFAATQIAAVFLDGLLVVRDFTPAASEIFSLRGADIGRPLTDLVSTINYPELQDHVEQVLLTEQPLDHRAASTAKGAHYLVRLVPYLDQKDEVHGVVVTFVDISVLTKTEAHLRVLVEELNHRVKNMLSVVISVATATHRTAPTPDLFIEQLVGRLHGMARVYDLLSSAPWGTVEIKAIIATEVEAHGTDRVDAVGPNVSLGPHQALPVGMVLHELLTNAAKYGALSNDDGRIRIKWMVEHHQLVLSWREIGGPTVATPSTNGFGMTFIESQIEGQLEGSFTVDFDAAGLLIGIAFPLLAT